MGLVSALVRTDSKSLLCLSALDQVSTQRAAACKPEWGPSPGPDLLPL